MSKKTKKDSKKESRWDDRILARLVSEIVNSNNCIFFIGGGLSRQLGYPPWDGVLEELAKIGLESSYIPDINKKRIKKKIRDNNFTGLLEEMDDIFEHCRADYAEAIKIMFGRKKESFAQHHVDIVSLLGKYLKGIITTNFDFCIENAAQATGIDNVLPTSNIDTFLSRNSSKYIYHIHNTVEMPLDCIICRRQYGKLYFDNTDPRFLDKIKSILKDSTIVYIGTSFRDYEIEQILSNRGILASGNNYTALKYHYAICPVTSDIDPAAERERIRANYKIHVQYYDVINNGSDEYGEIGDHQILYKLISILKEECEKYKTKSSIEEATKPLNEVNK